MTAATLSALALGAVLGAFTLALALTWPSWRADWQRWREDRRAREDDEGLDEYVVEFTRDDLAGGNP